MSTIKTPSYYWWKISTKLQSYILNLLSLASIKLRIDLGIAVNNSY
jgi:hypothetical protein